MDLTSALPLGIGAASAALGGAKSVAAGVFSLFDGAPEESHSPDSPASGSSLETFLASSGILGTDPGELQDDLTRSLEELQRMLRDAFHQSGQKLPESFQLQINADGTLDVSSNDAFGQQARSLLQESSEASRILNQIAAQAAAIDAATRQEKFARDYNTDPAAAMANQLQESQRPSIDIAFVDGQPASYQLVSG